MIISDSSPLIHLAKIGWLTLLNKLFKRVIIPKSVFEEVVIKGEEKGYFDAKIIRKATEEWIEIRGLNKEELEELHALLKISPMGLAEGEAITLAKSMKLPLLIDDTTGQEIAKSLNIETYWTTSVILRAYYEQLITKQDAKKIIEDLINSGLRVKADVIVKLIKILE